MNTEPNFTTIHRSPNAPCECCGKWSWEQAWGSLWTCRRCGAKVEVDEPRVSVRHFLGRAIGYRTPREPVALSRRPHRPGMV
jgi:hypothetical protein